MIERRSTEQLSVIGAMLSGLQPWQRKPGAPISPVAGHRILMSRWSTNVDLKRRCSLHLTTQ
jgi:hypothetical protein